MAQSFLQEALIFLAAALLVVPICSRLGLNSVLAYLGAGLLIGPPGLGLIRDPEEVLHLAELGVVLLLFLIGLELDPKRLWVMRRWVFGLGISQVSSHTAVLGGVLLLGGLTFPSAVLLGFALALSSTAFVLQLLGEQRKLHLAHGRAAFGTLLLQDLAVIPALVVLNLVGSDAGADHTAAVPGWVGLGSIAVGAIAARFLLRPILRLVATTQIQELFTAAALALVIGAALAMSTAGLSMGLGAFAAGMMVADSEYRKQLETDVKPFKGLLLGLFFIAVGMSVDLGLLLERPVLVLLLTLGLMGSKALTLWPLAWAQGLSPREAARTALVLSQGGEFAFVLLGAGLGAGVVEPDLAALAVVVVTLSMALTPVLVTLGDRILDRTADAGRPFDELSGIDEHSVVIAGFGRIGQIVARVLTMRHVPFTALDANPQHVDFVRKFGNETFYGDASRLDVLEAAGVGKARALVVAVSQHEDALQIVQHVKGLHPQLRVLARAGSRRHHLELAEAGADFVLRDTLVSSLEIATELLTFLGLPPSQAADAVARFREHDERTLRLQAAVFRDDEAFRRTTLSATEELKRLFAADAAVEAPSEGTAPLPESSPGAGSSSRAKG